MNTTTEEPVQPAGWKQWFATHGSRLLLFARQQTRTSEDAEDVLQEAMLRLAIVALRAPTNRLADTSPLMPKVLALLPELEPGEVVEVST